MGTLLIDKYLRLVEFKALFFVDGGVDAEVLEKEAEEQVLVDEGVEIMGDFGVDGQAAEEVDEDEVCDGVLIERLFNYLELPRIQHFQELQQEPLELLVVKNVLIVLFQE